MRQTFTGQFPKFGVKIERQFSTGQRRSQITQVMRADDMQGTRSRPGQGA
jgi:hypothetical protein